jgi:hypothetical protein
MDFIEAREKRREILSILRQQQADDAVCINQIKAVAIQGKQAILRALAEWLVSIKPGEPVNTSTRSAFAAVADRLTVEDWLRVQADCDEAEVQLRVAVDDERKANAVYDGVAPWGFASSFFADDARKKQIEPVKARRDAAKRAREVAQSALETAKARIATQCEGILRAASSPERVQRICAEPQLSRFLLPIIQDTATSGSTLWTTHSRKHATTSARMDSAVRELQAYYAGAWVHR